MTTRATWTQVDRRTWSRDFGDGWIADIHQVTPRRFRWSVTDPGENTVQSGGTMFRTLHAAKASATKYKGAAKARQAWERAS